MIQHFLLVAWWLFLLTLCAMQLFVIMLLCTLFDGSEDDPTCPICLESLVWSAQSLACGHRFHRKCIRCWMSDKKTCPCCRAAVL